jgi:Flp pilus assembly protein TadG
MIVLLMVMVGMGLDTGQLTYTRSQGQGAVDSAALAAVSGLPVSSLGNETQVTNRATAFNSNNDYVNSKSGGNPLTGSNITYVQYNDTTGAITALPNITGANGVRVALEKTNPYSGTAAGTGINTPAFLTPLMRLFGQSTPASNHVSVSAVAALKSVPGIPIAIMSKLCNGSSTVNEVKLLQTDANVDNSCWTTYTDNPPSASRVQALFSASRTCSGLPANLELITIGTLIELDNGQQASTYEEAEDLFINDAATKDRCWMVPVVPDSTKCNQQDQILDWAKICPKEVVKQGSPKYIKVDLTCNQNLFRTSDNLCFSARLVREPAAGM